MCFCKVSRLPFDADALLMHNWFLAGQKKEIRPGVWKLRVSAGKDPVTGKCVYVSKTVYGGSQMADQALAALVVAARTARSSITLVHLIDEFFQVSDDLAVTTRRNYRLIANDHILPVLGSKRIEKITGRDLDNLYRKMAEKGLGAASIRYAHALISRVFS